jgi:hypothetical protein
MQVLHVNVDIQYPMQRAHLNNASKPPFFKKLLSEYVLHNLMLSKILLHPARCTVASVQGEVLLMLIHPNHLLTQCHFDIQHYQQC